MAAHTKVIVYPTDFSAGSAASLELAKSMAQDFGAQIHCVYVIEEPHIYSTLDLGPVNLPSMAELEDSATGRLDKFVADNIADQDQPPVAAVLTGRPSEEIVSYANKQEAAMIVMATHGYSGMKHVLLGSTTEEVLRHAVCPVLSVRSE
jgi:nucleotide-binding universal stress UspA family protein